MSARSGCRRSIRALDLLRHLRLRPRRAGCANVPPTTRSAQAASGWLRLLINPENPRVVGPAIADAVTGFYAAFGVLGALHERGRTGRGRRIDMSMLEAMCHFNLDDFTHYFSGRTRSWGRTAGPACRSPMCSNVRTANGSRCTCRRRRSSGKAWRTRSSRPDLFQDPRFADRPARIAHQEDLIALMAPIFQAASRARMVRGGWTSEGVPFSPVYDSSEALEDRRPNIWASRSKPSIPRWAASAPCASR